MPDPPRADRRAERIGWVLVGPESVPSARIQGYNLHRLLLRHGLDSVIVREPGRYSSTLEAGESDEILARCRALGVTHLILQKVQGREAVGLAGLARGAGMRVVFLACDGVDDELAERCDVVIAVSAFLASLFTRRQRHRIHVVEEALEVPEAFRAIGKRVPSRGRLKAVYLARDYPDAETRTVLRLCAATMDVTVVSAPPAPASGVASPRLAPASPPWPERLTKHGAEIVPRAWRAARYRYRAWAMRARGSEGTAALAFRPWSLTDVHDVLAQHDVGLIPVLLDSSFRMAKSTNRLATLLAIGLPVIAAPVPSYREHALDGVHVLYADSLRQWRRSVSRLDRDREFAQTLGEAGQRLAWERFAPEVVLTGFCRIVGLSAGATLTGAP